MPTAMIGYSWTFFHIFIAILMVITGSINTLTAKWADKLKGNDGRNFDHPFLQAVCMFIGEFLCLIVFIAIRIFRKCRRNQQQQGTITPNSDFNVAIETEHFLAWNPLIFLPPACCDIIGTSLMYLGLNLTHASSFQMLRGAVIIFTGLLSVAFLGQILRAFRWLGIIFISLGLIIVGLSDILFGSEQKSDLYGIITGDLLIVMAQIVVAIQMVYEQKYLSKYNVPPLLAVGLEGFFGMWILSLLLLPMYFVTVPVTFSHNPSHRMEDIFDALGQMSENPLIVLALSGTVASIAFFNFAGITMTKELSATTRMVLDSVRTLIIWAVSVGFSWQQLIWLQIAGFLLLIFGMLIYNDLIFGPWIRNFILPYLGERHFSTGGCYSFWGLNFDFDDQDQLVRSRNSDLSE